MVEAGKLGLARRIRRVPSASECVLWEILRDRRLGGLKFRRHVPVGRFDDEVMARPHRIASAILVAVAAR
ncbi:MAG: DUF559 domain-containing protein [Caulobacteraceae bacterium]